MLQLNSDSVLNTGEGSSWRLAGLAASVVTLLLLLLFSICFGEKLLKIVRYDASRWGSHGRGLAKNKLRWMAHLEIL